jgi:opacity protein-like surface antigen
LIGLEAGVDALTSPNALNYDFTTGGGGALVNNQINRSIPWVSTVQVRLATTALSPSVLLYLSGGLAYGRESIKATVNTATPFPGSVPLESFPFSISADKTGAALGGGLEWLIGDKWSMKAEYQSIRLPAISARTSVTTVFGPSALPTDAMSIRPSAVQLNIFRLGVNYHFGPHAGK